MMVDCVCSKVEEKAAANSQSCGDVEDVVLCVSRKNSTKGASSQDRGDAEEVVPGVSRQDSTGGGSLPLFPDEECAPEEGDSPPDLPAPSQVILDLTVKRKEEESVRDETMKGTTGKQPLVSKDAMDRESSPEVDLPLPSQAVLDLTVPGRVACVVLPRSAPTPAVFLPKEEKKEPARAQDDPFVFRKPYPVTVPAVTADVSALSSIVATDTSSKEASKSERKLFRARAIVTESADADDDESENQEPVVSIPYSSLNSCSYLVVYS